MNQKDIDIQLLTEVLQWIQLQKGREWNFEEKSKYDTGDFKFVEDFLREEINDSNHKTRQNFYGFISAKSIQRFCNEIVGFEKQKTEVQENVPIALAAIAMKNRNPNIDISLKPRGDITKEDKLWKATTDLRKEYYSVKLMENSHLDKDGALAKLNGEIDEKNKRLFDLEDDKVKLENAFKEAKEILDNQSPNYETLKSEKGKLETELSNQQKWKKWLAYLSSVLAVTLLIMLSKICSLKEGKSVVISSDDVIPQEIIGKYLTTRNMYFRMKDTNLVWHFPKLEFYTFKDEGLKNQWIVKAKGIYRDSSDYPARMDSSIEHIGVIRRHKDFYQFELRPKDSVHFEKYGKWYATIFEEKGDNLEDALKKNNIYGIGGGISKYEVNNEGLSQISSYIFRIDKNEANLETLNEMSKQIDTSYKYINTRPLRTIFKKDATQQNKK